MKNARRDSWRYVCFQGRTGQPLRTKTSGPVPKGRIRLGFHGIYSADSVAFDEGTNARAARVTFASFLDSNRSCRPVDIRLNGSRDVNRKSN